jgi:nucleoside-diphosphate-sugar epimerase
LPYQTIIHQRKDIMILVTGATGHLGKAVVHGLLKKNQPCGNYCSRSTRSPGNPLQGPQQREFAKTSRDLEQLLGRMPSTLNEFIIAPYYSN